MKRSYLIVILFASVIFTGCLKFGHKPAPNPNALNLTNLKGTWVFYSDTVIASSGGLASAVTHDYNDLTGYYFQFITDSTGVESLGSSVSSKFKFKYSLHGTSLIINYINDSSNPDYNFTLPVQSDIVEFSKNKMWFRRYGTGMVSGANSETSLRMTR